MAQRIKRVLIVCSSGGHLQEAMLATEGVEMDSMIATYILAHIKDLTAEGVTKVYHLVDPHKSLVKYALNFCQSLWLMLRVRPDVVLTTGAGIAIASALIGKIMGGKLVFVETAACVKQLSRTGAFLYPYADLFIVQWPELLKNYSKAIYGGCLL